MNYNFTFHFPNLDPDRQKKVVASWGGTLGTAFKRAWAKIREDRMYQGFKKLRPSRIDIDIVKQ